MARNGSDVLLLANTGTADTPIYEAVGSQRGITFEDGTEGIDTSSKDGRAARALPGRYSATISLDGLYVPSDDAYQALRSAMRNGTLIVVARQEEGAIEQIADALVTALANNFPDQGEGVISASLTIDGEWSTVVTIITDSGDTLVTETGEEIMALL